MNISQKLFYISVYVIVKVRTGLFNLLQKCPNVISKFQKKSVKLPRELKWKFACPDFKQILVFSRAVSQERSNLSTHYSVRMCVCRYVCRSVNFRRDPPPPPLVKGIWLDICLDQFFFSFLHLSLLFISLFILPFI